MDSKLNKTVPTETVETIINGQTIAVELKVAETFIKPKVEKPVKPKVAIVLDNDQIGATLQIIDTIIKHQKLNMSTEGDVVQFRVDDATFKNRLKKLNKFKKLIEFKKLNNLELSEETVGTEGFETYQMTSQPGFTIISFGKNTMVLSDHFTRGEEKSNVIYFGQVFVDGVVDQVFVDDVSQYLKLMNKRVIPGDYAWKK
jgi:hypothetical protein